MENLMKNVRNFHICRLMQNMTKLKESIFFTKICFQKQLLHSLSKINEEYELTLIKRRNENCK